MPPHHAPVHPRVCGELALPQIEQRRIVGSSPRVGGTPVGSELRSVLQRFIPACVGNSDPTRAPRLILPVHPRVCGELPANAVKVKNPTGSSPRVWGTRR